MKELNFSDAGQMSHLVWPVESDDVGVDSPALSILNDFTRSLPLVIGGNISISDAKADMKHQHTGFKCVVDEHEEFVGVVSLDDLSDEEIIKKVATGYDRAELSVSDFMCPKSTLRAMNYAQIEPMRVYTLLRALRGYNGHHCLIIDERSSAVRGLVAASDVVHKMGLPLDQWAASFADVWMCLSQRRPVYMSA